MALSSKMKIRALRFCAVALLFGTLAQAQQAPAAQPAPAATDDESTKRVLGVLPNYRTAEESDVFTPITSHRKLVIATKDSIDYPLVFVGGVLAGLGQMTNSHPRFGQGVKGFAHRWGTSYIDLFVGNYLSEGFLPILFHEDPRYFRRGSSRGGVMNRTFYSASRIFITKTDHGKQTFNFAEVVGNGIAAGVGNAYYPGERKLGDNVSRLAGALATDAISQILKEFWPDVRRKYLTRHPHAWLMIPPSKTAAQPGS
jgi:hypothetical protein